MIRRGLAATSGVLLAMLGAMAVYGLGAASRRAGPASPAWRWTVTGARGRHLTKVQSEVVFLAGAASGVRQWPSTRRVLRIIPQNALVVPALDVIGARLGRGAARRSGRPKTVATTIHRTLTLRLGRVLPPGGEVIVVDPQGEVMALVSRGQAWRQTVPANALLLPPMLAEALRDPSRFSRLTSVQLPRLADAWGRDGMRAAWMRLGLGQAALPTEAVPTGTPLAIFDGSDYSVHASLASVAEAYLPFINHGRAVPPTVVLMGGVRVARNPTPSTGSAEAFSEVARQLPRLALGGGMVAVWHPIGQSEAVGWNSGASSWLAVTSAVPVARLAAVYAAIQDNLGSLSQRAR